MMGEGMGRLAGTGGRSSIMLSIWDGTEEDVVICTCMFHSASSSLSSSLTVGTFCSTLERAHIGFRLSRSRALATTMGSSDFKYIPVVVRAGDEMCGLCGVYGEA